MKNLVEKFTPQSIEATDDGVVAIEYVLVAGFVFAGVGLVFAVTGIWAEMVTELSTLF